MDDLILKLGREPEKYDPDRGTLSAYLRMAARGDVKNALVDPRSGFTSVKKIG